MARLPRIKRKDGIYHIYSRSISELILFKENSDKEKFLQISKKYKFKYNFKIYAYCIMGTHYHFIIFCNGADISNFMKCINQCYSQYYNRKYQRHGHVFENRFNSILVNEGTDRDLFRLSAYIHNNPKNMKDLNGDVRKYLFSSLNIYLGIGTDKYNIVDTDFLLNKLSPDLKESQFLYKKFFSNYVKRHETILSYSDKILKSNKLISAKYTNSDAGKKYSAENVFSYVSKITCMPNLNPMKYRHKNTLFKALSIIIMQSVCNFSSNKICELFNNISCSNVSKLSSIGYLYIIENEKYKHLIDGFKEYTLENSLDISSI